MAGKEIAVKMEPMQQMRGIKDREPRLPWADRLIQRGHI